MKKYFKTYGVLKGIILSNLFALISIWLSKYVLQTLIPAAYYVYSDFILVPLVMGIICAWFWRSLQLGTLAYIGYALISIVIGLLLSAIVIGEGYICLLICSPLPISFIITGVFIGKYMFRKKNNTLNVSILSLLLLAFLFDSVSDHTYENEVTDTVLIHAPPMEVWKHVVAFDPITEPNHYFLFRIGLPSPVQSTVDGYYEGAGRKCIFSNGYVFDEKMVVYKPGENLTFDITKQPRDPEIMGHIDILRGQFLLHDNGDGTTTLTGNSWYKLYVFPSWYYDLWAQSITSNVHIRAMQHIKQLSEMK